MAFTLTYRAENEKTVRLIDVNIKESLSPAVIGEYMLAVARFAEAQDKLWDAVLKEREHDAEEAGVEEPLTARIVLFEDKD